jgi:hypothetical protein
MQGFMSLGWHAERAHGSRHRWISVFDDGTAGQGELYFCSTKCMRSFFNILISALEGKRGSAATYTKPALRGRKSTSLKSGRWRKAPDNKQMQRTRPAQATKPRR